MKPFALNMRQRLVYYERPLVMGIINATPDSFYATSRVNNDRAVAERVEMYLREGADIIDVGACSTRPGAPEVSADEELRRLEACMAVVRKTDSKIPVSVDTWRADVAVEAVRNMGADIINDVSGGTLDDKMLQAVVDLQCPYIMTHMRSTPADMQNHTDYGQDVVTTVIAELQHAVRRFTLAGVSDIIVDPGFGFAKTMEQNYELLRRLAEFEILKRPILVGVSRKSMITKALEIDTEEALNATTAIHTMALERGASILRVHDVVAARQVCRIYELAHSSICSHK